MREHYVWLLRTWTPTKESYLSLRETYQTPEFRTFYDERHPELLPYLVAAIIVITIEEINMQHDIEQIQKVIDNYFYGTFETDAKRLRQAFHPDAKITGNINGNYVEMDLDNFVQRVTTAKTTNTKRIFDKKIIGLDINHDLAMVKAKVLVDDIYFIDLITLLKINGEWLIRQKSFTNATT